MRFNSVPTPTLTLTLLIFGMTALLPANAFAQNEPFALGADISWVQQRENPTSAGGGNVRYYRNGQTKDMLEILKGGGFNYIRLRLFVDPSAIDPSVPNDASGWNPFPYSTRGYCGLDSTIKYAKKVKDAGFKFLLDFHYSDTWADPRKQYKPMSWRNLNFEQLTARVRSYTSESVQAFIDAGARPDMVQVGNEIVHGMIYPDGQSWAEGGVGGMRSFATLVNAGINGVKDVDENILIMIHTVADGPDCSRNRSDTSPNQWINNLRTNLNNVESGAANKIDVIGISFYPMWHCGVDVLSGYLTSIVNNTNHNYKINVVEYADHHRAVNDLVWNLPANRRHGTFVWEPQEFAGDDSKPLFDWRNNPSGRHTNALFELYPQMARDYGITGGHTNIANKNISSKAICNTDFSVNSRGIIAYNSNIPGVITIYNMNGRVMGRINVSAPGIYNSQQLLQKPLRSGAYIIAIEPRDGKKQMFSSRIVK